MLKKILFLLLLLLESLSAGSRLMVNASLDDTEIAGDLDISSILTMFGEDSYFIGLNAMGIGTDPSTGDAIYSLYSAKIFTEFTLTPFEDIEVEFGLKYVYTEINGQVFMALPVGISAFYIIPKDNMHPIFRGSVYYGPAHLALLDAKDYLEYRAGAGFQMDNIRQVFESALGTGLAYFQAFLEYRSINTNYNNADVVLNETFYLGIKLAF